MNQQNKKFNVLGIMSGTSFDGIDFCHASFQLENGKWEYSINATKTYEYSTGWKDKILSMENADASELIQLHFAYGTYLGRLSQDFIKKNQLQTNLIASHGHTIFHQIDKGFTFQLGHGAAITAASGIKSVSDFRSLDVALGGEGAPLVPIGDQLIFQKYSCCINLGGISNLSFIKEGKRVAFDVSPANMVINFLYQESFEGEFDKDGEVSKSGKLNQKLLAKLNQLSYYHIEPPKSLGKEWIFENVIPLLKRSSASTEDKLYTFSFHIAEQLNIILSKNNIKTNVLITGGGAKNKFLMSLIESHGIRTEQSTNEIIDYKEALIFAFLGVLRIQEKYNTLKEVTGAIKNSCGGTVFLP